ncbi:putative Histone deacetylase 6 [Paratrimastix pyriformis]|uniref:Histone deacetylase 6 n=1 Tax=Paratrimastix pyriformis TaxID=342808 RepID=A0ABQ8UAP2_9EUKA|nr:putative Histone deacetylase 6 [Paratrimastix pyriformis]
MGGVSGKPLLCPHLPSANGTLPENFSSHPIECDHCHKTCDIGVCLVCHQFMCSDSGAHGVHAHMKETGHALVFFVDDFTTECLHCRCKINPMVGAQLSVFAAFYERLHGKPLPLTPEQQQRRRETPVVTSVPEWPVCPTWLMQASHPPTFAPVLGTLHPAIREALRERIKGALYGQAVGDAIGLLTEFMSPREALRNYGALLKAGRGLEYEHSAQDMHRCRWKKGDWTDDSDQMMLILEGLVECGGAVNPQLFALRLWDWSHRGFPEFGDQGGMGIGQLVSSVLAQREFLKDAHTTAQQVWETGGKVAAANGSVMRTSVLGLVHALDLNQVASDAAAISRVTHFDPRCVASCVASCVALAAMIQETLRTPPPADPSAPLEPLSAQQVEDIVQKALAAARPYLTDPAPLPSTRPPVAAADDDDEGVGDVSAVAKELDCRTQERLAAELVQHAAEEEEGVMEAEGVAPTQAAPTQAAPTQAAPTQAAPTQAAPTQAAPTQAAPTQAAPTQAAPTQAAPTQAAPTHPAARPGPLSAQRMASAAEDTAARQAEFDRHMRCDDLAALELGHEKTMGYTLKCAGAGFYALRHGRDFRETMTRIVMEGGDADTNGAVAGSLLGCKLGFSQLPPSWLQQMPYRSWLDCRVALFLRLLGLDDPADLPVGAPAGTGLADAWAAIKIPLAKSEEEQEQEQDERRRAEDEQEGQRELEEAAEASAATQARPHRD